MQDDSSSHKATSSSSLLMSEDIEAFRDLFAMPKGYLAKKREPKHRRGKYKTVKDSKARRSEWAAPRMAGLATIAGLLAKRHAKYRRLGKEKVQRALDIAFGAIADRMTRAYILNAPCGMGQYYLTQGAVTGMENGNLLHAYAMQGRDIRLRHASLYAFHSSMEVARKARDMERKGQQPLAFVDDTTYMETRQE